MKLNQKLQISLCLFLATQPVPRKYTAELGELAQVDLSGLLRFFKIVIILKRLYQKRIVLGV